MLAGQNFYLPVCINAPSVLFNMTDQALTYLQRSAQQCENFSRIFPYEWIYARGKYYSKRLCK